MCSATFKKRDTICIIQFASLNSEQVGFTLKKRICSKRGNFFALRVDLQQTETENGRVISPNIVSSHLQTVTLSPR